MKIGGKIVKRRLLSVVLATVLFASLPFPALATNSSSVGHDSKETIAAITDPQARVTAEVFLKSGGNDINVSARFRDHASRND